MTVRERDASREPELKGQERESKREERLLKGKGQRLKKKKVKGFERVREERDKLLKIYRSEGKGVNGGV